MNRGDVVIATGPGFGKKPRPFVVMQSDAYQALPTVVLLPITTDLSEQPSALRIRLNPRESNGLRRISEVMADIPVTARAEKVHRQIGTLSDTDMVQVERALLLVLGVAG